jgi:hypothetical protein
MRQNHCDHAPGNECCCDELPENEEDLEDLKIFENDEVIHFEFCESEDEKLSLLPY